MSIKDSSKKTWIKSLFHTKSIYIIYIIIIILLNNEEVKSLFLSN